MSEAMATPAAFGRYRVQSKLGAGGMGAVFLARDEALDRDVAVKVLRPLVMFGEPPSELLERFRRESRAVAVLSHPNVVRVYDQGIEGDLPYLVMELVRGPTLSDLIQKGPLAVSEARTLGIQIASALAAAHGAGVIHRDVKPSNVLQSGPGSWKLADFGIAQVADSSLTITGQFLGTPAFASPESLEGRAVGPAADVYSLGATLYAALVGEPPYGDLNLAQLVVAISRRRPAPLLERRPDLPPGVCAAIDRALSLAPEERPSATDLAAALAMRDPAPADRDRAATPPSVALPAAPLALAPAPARSPLDRRARLFLVGAAVLGAIAIAIAVASSGEKTARPAGSPIPTGAATPAPIAQPDAQPTVQPGTPPPWHSELPPELTRPVRGRPSEAQRRWILAYQGLQHGDWDRAQEELEAIAAADPDDRTARRWLRWMEAAKRDPESFGVLVEED